MKYLLISICVFIIFYAICKLKDPTITVKDIVDTIKGMIRDIFKSGPTSEEREKARHKSYLPILESLPLYRTGFVWALKEAVVANAQACALARPVDVTNHLMAPGQGVILDNYGNLLFCYRFRRAVVCPGGGKVEYSTLPTEEMTKTLNQALPNYCLKNGVWVSCIVGQEDVGSGVVYFYIKPFNDWIAVENYLRNGGYII